MRGKAALPLALLLALTLPSALSAASESHPCAAFDSRADMDLAQVVNRALCNNPQTRQAWANVNLQTALTGVQRAAFLPSASGTLEAGRMISSAGEPPEPVRGGSATFSWTLFDSGLRSANLDNARHLLAAAHAMRDATTQEVIAAAAQAYFGMLTARAALDAAGEAEQAARQSLAAADARHRAGIGILSDRLLAQTTHAEAVLQRIRAEGAGQEAQGALAVALGLPPQASVSLRDTEALSPPDAGFLGSVDKLITEAKQQHPALLAAQAELRAAHASVDAAKAEALPTVSLTGAIQRNRLAMPDGAGGGRAIGIQISIPLFDGRAQSHRVQAARAQAEAKTAALDLTERQVAVEAWKAYQSLRTETNNLDAIGGLLHNARESFRVAQGRYQAGVGTMLELLNAQSALANVRQQRVTALSEWHNARLRLAASLGKLDPVTVSPPHAAPPEPVLATPAYASSSDTGLAHRMEVARIMETIERWAQAWRKRDVDAYLAFYAGDFQTPQGLSRQAWEKQRRTRIEGKRRIDVRIELQQITIGDGDARLTFRQAYVSDRLNSDSMKTLALVKQGSAWKIRQEREE